MDESVASISTGKVLRPSYGSTFPIGWLIVVIILAIALIVVLYFFFRQRTQLIEPTNCPKIMSSYAVQAGVTKSTLTSCGDRADQPCMFTARTLVDAISRCEAEHKICTQFTFDPTVNIMRIVDPTGSPESTQQENLYLRQTGTIDVPI